MSVLEVSHLSKSYSATDAVSDITFNVSAGEIVGLLGPNGAGKTTTVNMILGVLAPSGGTISIGGIDLRTNRSVALSQTNFAAVYAPLPGNLTVKENLQIFGRLYGLSNLNQRIAELVEQYNLINFSNTKCGLLSSGEQTRVCLAKANLNNPKLLLLDEPTASLDPSTAREARKQIRTLAKDQDVGILWTSHNMYEVEEVCDRVLFLSKGKVLLEGDPKILPETHNQKTLEDLFVSLAREPLSYSESRAI